jgi:hypothetical protein
MKFFVALLGLVLLAGVATSADVTFYKDTDGVDYFTGTFYKDAKTGEVFKVVSETADTIYLGEFESGQLQVK